MKKILCTIAILMFSASFLDVQAQWSFSASADLQSRYIWRGQPLGGEGPSLQPGASLSWQGLSLSVWGAYNIGICEYQELDWTLSYSFLDEMFNIQVTDYAFPSLLSNYHYFDYESNHVIEAGISFAVPHTDLALSVYTNVYGADAVKADGSLNYSTYAEASYTLGWESANTDFDFAIGAALNGEDGASFYGNDGFGIVNIACGATKTIGITPSFQLPVYIRAIANPVADKMFLLCGATIQF